MGERRRRRPPTAVWVLSIGLAVSLLALGATFAWTALPRIAPRLVQRWTPWARPGLRAMAYAATDDEEADSAFLERAAADRVALLRAELALVHDGDRRVRARACSLLVSRWYHVDESLLPGELRQSLVADLWTLAVGSEPPPAETAFGSPDDVREQALQWLAELHDPRIVPIALRRIAEDDRPGIVTASAEALVAQDPDGYAPAMVEAWRRRPDAARAAALATFPPAALDPLLVEAMDSVPPAGCVELIHQLGWKQGHARLLASLARHASGQPGEIRGAAIAQLHAGDPDEAAELREIAIADDDLAEIAYCRLHPEWGVLAPDASVVEAALEASRAEVRRRALIDVDYLAPADRARLTDRVFTRLTDQPTVAAQAVTSLTGLDAAPAAAAIARALADRDTRVRIAALLIIGGRDDDIGLDALERAWSAGDPSERAAALVTQARRGSTKAAAHAIASLDDHDPELRGAACSALRRLVVEDAADALLGLLRRERDPRVCAAALNALDRLPSDDERERAVDAARDALETRYGTALHSPWDDW